MNKEVLKFVDQIVNKVVKSGIAALEVEVEGIKVRAERGNSEIAAQAVTPSVATGLAKNQQQDAVKKAPAPEDGLGEEQEEGKIVRSPIVGTFYLTPSPSDPPFVKVGQQVKKGDVVCIVEAMKILNEIESEYDGVVKAILADKGALVEYGQPLIIIG